MTNPDTLLGILNLVANGGCGAMLFYIIITLLKRRNDRW